MAINEAQAADVNSTYPFVVLPNESEFRRLVMRYGRGARKYVITVMWKSREVLSDALNGEAIETSRRSPTYKQSQDNRSYKAGDQSHDLIRFFKQLGTGLTSIREGCRPE